MDNTKPYTKAPKPEIGRGCTFYYAPEGVAAKPCEGCYKLHETAWLEQYPQHTPTDIFEVRFKNTRRSYYQNVNNLPLERVAQRTEHPEKRTAHRTREHLRRTER